jgi:Tetratricopeptide repeat
LRLLLPDRRRVLGNDDPQTLRTAHMLARNLAATGEANEAVALLKEVVAARERVLGSDHPHTMRAARDLAVVLEPNSGQSHG